MSKSGQAAKETVAGNSVAREGVNEFAPNPNSQCDTSRTENAYHWYISYQSGAVCNTGATECASCAHRAVSLR